MVLDTDRGPMRFVTLKETPPERTHAYIPAAGAGVLVLALCPATAAFADEDLATRIGASRDALPSSPSPVP